MFQDFLRVLSDATTWGCLQMFCAYSFLSHLYHLVCALEIPHFLLFRNPHPSHLPSQHRNQTYLERLSHVIYILEYFYPLVTIT